MVTNLHFETMHFVGLFACFLCIFVAAFAIAAVRRIQNKSLYDDLSMASIGAVLMVGALSIGAGTLVWRSAKAAQKEYGQITSWLSAANYPGQPTIHTDTDSVYFHCPNSKTKLQFHYVIMTGSPAIIGATYEQLRSGVQTMIVEPLTIAGAASDLSASC